MKEVDIIGYEGQYKINTLGEVFSLNRKVIGVDGKSYFFKGKQLTITYNPKNNAMSVDLWKNNKPKKMYIHRLLGTHFIPNPDNKPEINHIDGNRANNKLCNLEWCTSSENKQHAIQTGLRVYTNRLTHKQFISCLQSVINGESYSSLSNRVPYKVPYLSTKLRKLAKELGIEYLLDESLYLQKVKRARINGNNNKSNP